MRKTSLNWLLPLLLLILCGAIAGCRGSTTETDSTSVPASPAVPDELARNLDQMEALWGGQGPAHYRFQFNWICFCPAGYREPVWLTVSDGEIQSVEPVDPETDVSLPGLDEYQTISELFNLIREGVEQNAHDIQVDYDPELGYPTHVHIDYDRNIEDEERGFDIAAFETLGR